MNIYRTGFKDLSFWLKVAAIGGWIYAASLVLAGVWGFLNAL